LGGAWPPGAVRDRGAEFLGADVPEPARLTPAPLLREWQFDFPVCLGYTECITDSTHWMVQRSEGKEGGEQQGHLV
jgi:hypothetical protein